MFNKNAFLKAKYIPRTEEVVVDGLAMWFEEDEKPVWLVRGLTSSEMATCNEAVAASLTKANVVEALASTKGQVDSIRATLGINTDNTPSETVKRLQQLVLGTIEPVLDAGGAMLLAERHPVEFYMITNSITVLTGLGMDVEK